MFGDIRTRLRSASLTICYNRILKLFPLLWQFGTVLYSVFFDTAYPASLPTSPDCPNPLGNALICDGLRRQAHLSACLRHDRIAVSRSGGIGGMAAGFSPLPVVCLLIGHNGINVPLILPCNVPLILPCGDARVR